MSGYCDEWRRESFAHWWVDDDGQNTIVAPVTRHIAMEMDAKMPALSLASTRQDKAHRRVQARSRQRPTTCTASDNDPEGVSVPARAGMGLLAQDVGLTTKSDPCYSMLWYGTPLPTQSRRHLGRQPIQSIQRHHWQAQIQPCALRVWRW